MLAGCARPFARMGVSAKSRSRVTCLAKQVRIKFASAVSWQLKTIEIFGSFT